MIENYGLSCCRDVVDSDQEHVVVALKPDVKEEGRAYSLLV